MLWIIAVIINEDLVKALIFFISVPNFIGIQIFIAIQLLDDIIG